VKAAAARSLPPRPKQAPSAMSGARPAPVQATASEEWKALAWGPVMAVATSGESGVLQRKCEKCGPVACSCDEQTVQAKRETGDPPGAIAGLFSLNSAGQPLSPDRRAYFGARFDRDFSTARIHDDLEEHTQARAAGAQALTGGTHIAFAEGRFRPGSDEGDLLFAHELAHVLQQDGGGTGFRAGALASDAHEREADSAAEAVVFGALVGRLSPVRAPVPQYKCDGVPLGTIQAASKDEQPVARRLPALTVRRDFSHIPLLRRALAVGWAGKTAENKNETTVETIRRIPIGGPSTPTATGQVVVLLPQGLKPTEKVDVLFHLHGHNTGNANDTGYANLRDQRIDEIEKQLAASRQTQMVGVLPQGTAGSHFGKTTAGLNSDLYISAVFDALTALKIWTTKPSVGKVLFSAHSGGGGPIGEEMLSKKSGTSMPAALGELALFDAINGPNETKAVTTWVVSQLADDLTKLSQPGMTDEAQKQYLKASMRFRGFHTGPAGAKPDSSKDASYASRYAVVQQAMDNWFQQNNKALALLSADRRKDLRENYQIISVTADIHNKIVAGGHLKLAIQDLRRRPSHAEAANPMGETVPEPVVHALRSSGQPLPTDTRLSMQSSFGSDFSAVRIHHDGIAARAAQSVDALAFTVGRDIVFGNGQYAPHTPSGRRLLAHELTHAVQQQQIAPPADWRNLRVGSNDDPHEREASLHEQYDDSAFPQSRVDAPTIQRAPDQRALREQFCEDPAKQVSTEEGECTYREPENCPVYGRWIKSFARLKTFTAKDTAPGIERGSGFQTLGDKPASHDPKDEKEHAPAPVGPRLEDQFIDHATDQWVKECLPDNLRATAYQLPSDCADIAVILRHVWLSAHHRVEQFGRWKIGDAAGGAGQKEVAKVISEVSTGNVQQMVNPYANAAGRPLRTFGALEPLLHEGDVLVWEHHSGGLGTARSGGHTQTIANIERVGDKIKKMTLLQGNEPINNTNYPDISKYLKDQGKKDIPSRKQMGNAPGRRIEVRTMEKQDMNDLPPEKPLAWTWLDGHTTLVVAGPPLAATRPAMQKKGGVTVRRISDWFGSLRGAARKRLQPTFESALGEVRAVIEGGDIVPDGTASELGRTAGERLWSLAKDKPGFGNESHFEPLRQLQDTVRGLGDLDKANDKLGLENPHEDEVRRVFRLIERSFVDAARGGSTIDFTRSAKPGTRMVNTLLTGFDPFSGRKARTERGQWNPSGAAVLALDGKQVDAEPGTVAAVEGVVLPVDFKEFESGIVERIVSPQAKKVEAILTVSLDEKIDPADPVRLERYAVGVHKLNDGALTRIPAAPGGAEGPRIIEAPAPVETIAAETVSPAVHDREQKGSKKPGVQRPTIGNDIEFEFRTAAGANSARAELGMPPTNSKRLVIDDPATIKQIIGSAQEVRTSLIHFRVRPNGALHEADLLRGPGGDFLSNEVSYRVQRLLGETNSPKDPISFHTHTPGTRELLPGDMTAPKVKDGQVRSDASPGQNAAAALARAMEMKDRLIATLRSMIGVIARIIAHRKP